MVVACSWREVAAVSLACVGEPCGTTGADGARVDLTDGEGNGDARVQDDVGDGEKTGGGAASQGRHDGNEVDAVTSSHEASISLCGSGETMD